MKRITKPLPFILLAVSFVTVPISLLASQCMTTVATTVASGKMMCRKAIQQGGRLIINRVKNVTLSLTIVNEEQSLKADYESIY